jgi:hypothetical protein
VLPVRYEFNVYEYVMQKKVKVAAPVYKTEITSVETFCADHATPLYLQKLALTPPKSGDRSFGTVRSRTKVTELIVRLDGLDM